MEQKIRWKTLMYCVVGVLITGMISGIATADSISGWYAGLNKPVFNPPNWIFGPVWSLLYILMGVSLYLIWIQGNTPRRREALYLFFIQLALNFAWSFLFFYFQSPGWALLEIGVLWFFISWMILTFWGVYPPAAYLQIPYFLWVGFASLLNASIWYLN
ncbi:MAG TPA: TspO/MBR family protein [Saprospiraceae bacterium]|nr:TspO/MBR family protein [Saprospiraceae bacterium]